MKIGNNVSIKPYCDLYAGEVYEIEEGTDIGARNRIEGNIIIEKQVLFGPDNYIYSTDHCYEKMENYK